MGVLNYCPIPGASQPNFKVCAACKWWEPFNAVCFNGNSPYCADFVDGGCECWEGNDAYIEQYAAAVIKWGEEHPIKSQKECVSEVIPGSNDC